MKRVINGERFTEKRQKERERERERSVREREREMLTSSCQSYFKRNSTFP